MRKYCNTESTPEVVSPEAHKAIEKELHKFTQASVKELSDTQRRQVRNALDETEDTC